MNRETKRRLQRQGEPEPDGAPVEPRESTITTRRLPKDRFEERPAREGAAGSRSPVQFLREVRDELRQVAWPTRSEMVNYTTVVFTTLVIMIALIFVLNYAFGKGVLFLFQK